MRGGPSIGAGRTAQRADSEDLGRILPVSDIVTQFMLLSVAESRHGTYEAVAISDELDQLKCRCSRSHTLAS